MNEQFKPLGVREGWVPDSGPFEGVPEHLRQSLLDWIWSRFYRAYKSGSSSFRFDFLQRAEREVRFSSGINRHDARNNYSAVKTLTKFLAQRPETLLSVVDFVIYAEHDQLDLEPLQTILREAGSVYQVATTSGKPRLERRIEPHMEELARKEMDRGESASHLLRVAWSATLGRNPNPSEGYRNAVRAVEAAAIPVVLPHDKAATLGKVIGHLSATIDEWSFALPDRRDGKPSVQTVIDLLGTLWTSQYDRHVREGAELHVGARGG